MNMSGPIYGAVLLLLLCNIQYTGAGGFFTLSATLLNGTHLHFDHFNGKVTMVVNVASKCGLTHRDYTQLNTLQNQFNSEQFAIVAFPCNKSLHQEPGSKKKMLTFLEKYKVEFYVFDVNPGDTASPVYRFLWDRRGDVPNWNFGKFLVAPDGEKVLYFGPTTSPMSLVSQIKNLIHSKVEL